MKKILKRLGVLSLITAILLPFLELPQVNAETTECETHLHNYMFLDAQVPTAFRYYDDEYNDETEDVGYVTYANFPYVFPEDENYDVEVLSVEVKNITSTSQLQMFWSRYDAIETNMSSKNAFYEVFGKDEEQYGTIFPTTTNNQKYASNTILIHGEWANIDEDGDVVVDKTDWSGINEKEGYNNSLQKIFTDNFKDDSDLIDAMDVDIKGAIYNGDSNNGAIFEEINRNVKTVDFFNDLIDGKFERNPIWEYTPTGDKYVPLQITRTISNDDMKYLNDYTYGYEDEENNKYYVFSNETTTTVSGAKKSYDAMLEFYSEENRDNNSTEYLKYRSDITKSEFEKIDFVYEIYNGENEDTEYLYYYWPFVLNVEYSVCPVSNNVTPSPEDPGDEVPVGEWSVKYNGNVSDNSVTNIPKNQKASIGTDITLDSSKPSRDGYTFKKWCENKDGSGNCYNPGDKIESPEKTEIKELFAQWGKLDTEENKKTGVISYILGFASVGIVAGGIYLISKKKNLFKQI